MDAQLGAAAHAHTPNIVTVIIADYRGFDTLGEVVVVFAASLACLFLLRRDTPSRRSPFLGRKDNIIVDVVTRMMVPMMVYQIPQRS